MRQKNKNILRMDNALILCVDDIVKGICNKEEGNYYGKLEWENRSILKYTLNISKDTVSVNLEYSKGGRVILYNIPLQYVNSNLGKGKNYYFVCPFSFLRCKKLYMVGDSEYFKHRKAYDSHIYYRIQTLSENDKLDYRIQMSAYNIVSDIMKHPKTHYRNRATLARDMLIYKQYKYSALVEKKQNQVLRMIENFEKEKIKNQIALEVLYPTTIK